MADRVPLFLGGFDDPSNLEVIDADAYWTVAAGLNAGSRDLAVGERIDGVAGTD